MLSFVSENERTNIRQRQAEGIAAARKRGVRFGRPRLPLPENYPDAYQRWKAGQITGTAASRQDKKKELFSSTRPAACLGPEIRRQENSQEKKYL